MTEGYASFSSSMDRNNRDRNFCDRSNLLAVLVSISGNITERSTKLTHLDAWIEKLCNYLQGDPLQRKWESKRLILLRITMEVCVWAIHPLPIITGPKWTCFHFILLSKPNGLGCISHDPVYTQYSHQQCEMFLMLIYALSHSFRQ